MLLFLRYVNVNKFRPVFDHACFTFTDAAVHASCMRNQEMNPEFELKFQDSFKFSSQCSNNYIVVFVSAEDYKEQCQISYLYTQRMRVEDFIPKEYQDKK